MEGGVEEGQEMGVKVKMGKREGDERYYESRGEEEEEEKRGKMGVREWRMQKTETGTGKKTRKKAS